MDKNFLIQITNNLYRLTLLFPKKEPLRYKMREAADDILAEYLRLNFKYGDNHQKHITPDFQAELEVLNGFFEVAKEQNWVVYEEILNLQRNYNRLKEGLVFEKTLSLPLKKQKEADSERYAARYMEHPAPYEEAEKEIKENLKNEVKNDIISQAENEVILLPAEQNSSLPERQEKILNFLREQGRAQVWQIKQVLPEVTKRTLRRDFDNLLKKGLVERAGERNSTFYQIKIS